jgi:hypothetical protein
MRDMRILFFILPLLLLASARNGFSDNSPNTWTTLNDNDPSVTYSPGLEYGSRNGYFRSDMHTTQTVGAWASFSFTGTGVKWIGAKNVDHGQADIYIDGKLDATVSSVGPAWVTQQELYTRTGLTFGPHTMKIVVKTPNYTDFDAFAYLGPPLRNVTAGTMPKIRGVDLPPQQPLLNPATRYPIGNGVAVMICDPRGKIDTSFGPGYTTSDLISYEEVSTVVDGDALTLDVAMKRAAGTGVFYGLIARGDLDIGVLDFTRQKQPWISRLFVVRNNSHTASHAVVFRDDIFPITGKGYSHGVAADEAGAAAGLFVQADTSIGVNNLFPNPVDQSVIISFSDPKTSATSADQNGSLQSGTLRLGPGEQREISLVHYFVGGHRQTNAQAIAALRSLDADANLKKSIAAWQEWFAHVPPGYSLSRIKDPRARVLMEGALVILKTNQSTDGGVIAHTTYYKEGYIRDGAMGIRGLLATGHTEEAKRWLLWCGKKLSIDHHFADAMSCLPSLDDKSGRLDGGDMTVEEPAWVLLVARDYYAQTHDLAFLKSIDRTLRYSMDVQLQEAEANDGKLNFNGDETEICHVINFDSTGFGSAWALSSVAMAAASLDFYIDYVKATGRNAANYHNAQTNTTMDLGAEERKLVAAMDRDFWRTDVADIPGGFHDFFRMKGDNSWPKARLVNLTLMPVFFGVDYPAEEKFKDVVAMAQYFDAKSGFLPLVPGANTGMEGHDLGYLLGDLVEVGDWRQHEVYSALVNGPTVDAWGGYSEAYDPQGQPNGHDMRSLETGTNLSALANYWSLGVSKK